MLLVATVLFEIVSLRVLDCSVTSYITGSLTPLLNSKLYALFVQISIFVYISYSVYVPTYI